MTVPEARRDPRLRRFALRRHRLSVAAGGTLSVVAPIGSDDLLRRARIESDLSDPDLPYWADVWHASVAVARRLSRGPDLTGLRVLDLGCGVGVAGAAAGRRGAQVTFADREPDALAFAAFNAGQNGAARATTVRLDWQRETVAGTFDLILLADVTYDRRHHDPILRHLQRCLGHNRGRVLHADPFRADAERFLQRAGEHLSLQEERADTFFAGRRVPVRLTWLARTWK